MIAAPCESPTFGTLLSQLVAVVAQESSTADVGSRIAEQFVHRLQAVAARVYEGDNERSPLHLVAFDTASVERPTSGFASGHAGAQATRAARSGLVLRTQVSVAAGRFGDEGETGGDGNVSIAFPLFAGTITVGAVCAVFDSFPHQQSPDLRPLRYSLGALLGRARLHEEAARLIGDA